MNIFRNKDIIPFLLIIWISFFRSFSFTLQLLSVWGWQIKDLKTQLVVYNSSSLVFWSEYYQANEHHCMQKLYLLL